MVVEISKEAPPSTIPSQDTEVQFNYAQNKVGDEYRAPEPTTPVSAITRSREEREGITHSDETSLPLSERILHLNKVVERDHHMRELDAQRRRKRDSNGLLLRKNGRVDKRSLRFLGDQDSQTPSRWSIAPDLPGTSVAGAQSPDPLELPILPSIEQSQVIFEPGAEPQIRTPTDPRPIKCSSCKKQYTTRAGLRYHLEHAKNAACRQGTGSMAPEQFSCDTYNSKFVDLQTRDKVRSAS
ncbi:hypothetical protein N431DRAFT_338311 [Stipitochalara longipes BDJ]|nr:hypothetical protein N431DRAFT_338311 [Stipitochalara longipes BDJ]